MTNEQLLIQAETVRAITLQAFDGLSEEAADRIPGGFSNSIRWNLGHILITQEQMAIHFAGASPRLPAVYLRLFGNRTSPADWKATPPTLAELACHLQAQSDFVREQLGPRLQEPAAKPFVRLGRTMGTIGELLAYSLYHEGVHTGIISMLKKALAQERA